MKHVVKHGLSQELARKAADKAWESYAERFKEYSPTAVWTSDTRCEVAFKVKGVKLQGTMELEPGGIAMDLDVPFLLKPFRNKALDVIEREIRTWVGKAERGELN